MTKKILIIGKNGTLGSSVGKYLSQGSSGTYDIYYMTSNRESLDQKTFFTDFTNLHQLENIDIPFQLDHILFFSGYEPKLNLEETTIEHVNKMFKIHIIAPIIFLNKIIKKVNIGGSLLFVSSPASIRGSYDPAYSSVKGATNSLVKTLAKDYSESFRVNAISPSLIVDSTVYKCMTEDFKQKHLENTLTKKHTTCEDFCELVEYILNAKQMTGQIISLSGGMV